jgi:hypothetical protein
MRSGCENLTEHLPPPSPGGRITFRPGIAQHVQYSFLRSAKVNINESSSEEFSPILRFGMLHPLGQISAMRSGAQRTDCGPAQYSIALRKASCRLNAGETPAVPA